MALPTRVYSLVHSSCVTPVSHAYVHPTKRREIFIYYTTTLLKRITRYIERSLSCESVLRTGSLQRANLARDTRRTRLRSRDFSFRPSVSGALSVQQNDRRMVGKHRPKVCGATDTMRVTIQVPRRRAVARSRLSPGPENTSLWRTAGNHHSVPAGFVFCRSQDIRHARQQKHQKSGQATSLSSDYCNRERSVRVCQPRTKVKPSLRTMTSARFVPISTLSRCSSILSTVPS